MSLAFYIVVNSKVEGLDTFVDGKAVGHANQTALTTLCKKLNVRPLEEFISQDPEEMSEFLEDHGIEADNLQEQWFDAEDGLATVSALRRYLSENPTALKNSEALCEDLAEYERVLEGIKKENVQWHFAVDF